MQEKIGCMRRARRREKGLKRCVSSKIPVNGSAVISRNGFVESRRDIGEPLVLEAPSFCGEVCIVLPCHQTCVVQDCEETFTNVAKGFNDTWNDGFTLSDGVAGEFVLFACGPKPPNEAEPFPAVSPICMRATRFAAIVTIRSTATIESVKYFYGTAYISSESC